MTTGEPRTGEVHVKAFTLGSTEPFLAPGVYFLSAFYKSPLGDVSYGFKVEMVD